jgi:hypothetical protein
MNAYGIRLDGPPWSAAMCHDKQYRLAKLREQRSWIRRLDHFIRRL